MPLDSDFRWSPRRRAPAWLVAVAVLLLFCLGVEMAAVYLLGRPPQPPAARVVTVTPGVPPPPMPQPEFPELSAEPGELLETTLRVWLRGPYWAHLMSMAMPQARGQVVVWGHSGCGAYLPAEPGLAFIPGPLFGSHEHSTLMFAGRAFLRVCEVGHRGADGTVNLEFALPRPAVPPGPQRSVQLFLTVDLRRENGQWRVIAWTYHDAAVVPSVGVRWRRGEVEQFGEGYRWPKPRERFDGETWRLPPDAPPQPDDGR